MQEAICRGLVRGYFDATNVRVDFDATLAEMKTRQVIVSPQSAARQTVQEKLKPGAFSLYFEYIYHNMIVGQQLSHSSILYYRTINLMWQCAFNVGSFGK